MRVADNSCRGARQDGGSGATSFPCFGPAGGGGPVDDPELCSTLQSGFGEGWRAIDGSVCPSLRYSRIDARENCIASDPRNAVRLSMRGRLAGPLCDSSPGIQRNGPFRMLQAKSSTGWNTTAYHLMAGQCAANSPGCLRVTPRTRHPTTPWPRRLHLSRFVSSAYLHSCT